MSKAIGRPRATFNIEEVERLCQFSPTDEELAAALEVSAKTIQRKKADPKFAEAMERGKARGRMTLRRMQMKLASEGNATMQIWLGKQLLGQHDKLEQYGPGGSRPEVVVTIRQVGARSSEVEEKVDPRRYISPSVPPGSDHKNQH